MSGRLLKPNSRSTAAVLKVLFRPSSAGRSSQFVSGRRESFPFAEYEQSGILTFKDDPRNRLRKRDTFIEDIRGLSHAEIIRAAVAGKKNILTVGATGSGKTTFVNAVLDVMAQVAPHDRVISIEDTTELQCSVRNHVDLLAVGNVSMLDCLRALYAAEADPHRGR